MATNIRSSFVRENCHQFIYFSNFYFSVRILLKLVFNTYLLSMLHLHCKNYVIMHLYSVHIKYIAYYDHQYRDKEGQSESKLVINNKVNEIHFNIKQQYIALPSMDFSPILISETCICLQNCYPSTLCFSSSKAKQNWVNNICLAFINRQLKILYSMLN